MAAPALAVGLATQGASKISRVLDYPVVGVRQKITRVTKKRTVETDFSLQLRGWELIAGGLGAALVYWIYQGGMGNGTNRGAALNPLDPFGILTFGPLGALMGTMGSPAYGPSLPGVPAPTPQYYGAGWLEKLFQVARI